jgi:large subunit ribosomal protein L17
MRHRRRGRKLGRNFSHRLAMLHNLARSLFLTEIGDDDEENAPKERGRIVTTFAKAKEVQPIVERLVTLARKSFEHERSAEQFATNAPRNSEEWSRWRKSDQWRQWAEAKAPVVTARRRAMSVLGDRDAVDALFDHVAPRLEDRNGGYTRVVRLSTRRLGDAGKQAILEFVGKHERVAGRRSRPAVKPEAVGKAGKHEAAESQADDASAEAAES